MKAVFSMSKNGKTKSFLIDADGSAVDALTQERYSDFAGLFILLRSAGYEPASEIQFATPAPAPAKRERVTLRKAKADRRTLRPYDGFRTQWSEYEIAYEDNFSMD